MYSVLCGTCTIVGLCVPLFLYVYFFRSFLSKDPKKRKGFKILLRRGRLKGKEKEDEDKTHSPSKQVFVLQRVAGLLLFSCVLGTCRFAPEFPPIPKGSAEPISLPSHKLTCWINNPGLGGETRKTCCRVYWKGAGRK